MKDLIRVDARVGQRIVLFLRHGEHQPMSDHRTFRSRREFPQMLLPDFGNAVLALRIGKLRGRGARAVRIDSDAVMQESAGVDLSERFLRGIVGEVLELSADLLIPIGPLTKRDFPAGSFVKIFQMFPRNWRVTAGPSWLSWKRRDSTTVS